MAFFGLYIEGPDGKEYRVGFEAASDKYQPAFERLTDEGWQAIGRGSGLGDKNQVARALRAGLPWPIEFPEAHTQNEVAELINQVVYNMRRMASDRTNHGGAHE